jgi:hypothetical protein
MRLAWLVVGTFACGSSDSPEARPPRLAIVGYGVQLVLTPTTSASVLENGVMILGPRADALLPAVVKNVAIKPGKPPTAPLVPRPNGAVTIYSDGAGDTTMGVGMLTYDGILRGAALSERTGAWTIVSDGKDHAWPAGVRIDVADDGHTFKLVELAKK